MNLDNLVKMANQIGTFFAAMPDRDEALADIATHLRRFWAPPMRRALLEGVDNGQAEAVAPIVRAALERHRERL
ncbi:formate dehydrogenase subunit delta [Cupriavidus gilardii]|uniref:Formate dehydrogenase subunit delta n=1 Tax=Cupriavidus gilardii TaxID=82541 RepID=A0A6N1BSR6_9BURK|nr:MULTISPECIES: formate dehydrogenase subunit delta [Cupriavidus]ALD91267.1 NAD-dependent formate dehydrogenase delta subunit [Cupriavidus gilardii CR3]QQE06275.1 formate dehydrogenase subunit delta [Cupriavidus sp. ISTL7]KAB0598337.1 formate dehydrogenase subunit delta [Cupriavidus gilardii]MCD9121424.1 formate dehydrogenase subunit delta [Cupriavidus sp. UGS-1]MCT9012462.1 formate dehydrogenase subunit delta [Cupriavidus gilardii]